MMLKLKSIDNVSPFYRKHVRWSWIGVYSGSIIFGVFFWYELIRFVVSIL
jgi:hypothetical protein